jgi:hypothetical protein
VDEIREATAVGSWQGRRMALHVNALDANALDANALDGANRIGKFSD